MPAALGLIDRHRVDSLKEGLSSAYQHAFEKDNGVTLFRWQDWPAWVIFTTLFLGLIIFDNLVLHRNPKALTASRATFYTLFWIVMAGAFCAWVSWWYSPASAYMWWSGYLLEWMLSFDNLFVFHLVFTSYNCPDYLKHRPLFIGILGAVLMRLVFIFIGEYLMHAFVFMHFIFGAFLIYTGFQTVNTDEDEDDPAQQPLVLWLKQHMKLVNVYDSKAAFFVQCPVDESGEPAIPEDAIVVQEPTESSRLIEEGGTPRPSSYSERTPAVIVDFSSIDTSKHRMQTRATMLFLVCVCLNLIDLLFAVDSVSAIVAAVDDLFLAYTSAVFAMLGMRAIFFLINIMVDWFTLLKYGVAFILVFIGAKLIVGHFYHIPSSVVCLVLVGAIATSMIASVVHEKYEASLYLAAVKEGCCFQAKGKEYDDIKDPFLLASPAESKLQPAN